jgi:hypothetical protein
MIPNHACKHVQTADVLSSGPFFSTEDNTLKTAATPELGGAAFRIGHEIRVLPSQKISRDSFVPSSAEAFDDSRIIFFFKNNSLEQIHFTFNFDKDDKTNTLFHWSCF